MKAMAGTVEQGQNTYRLNLECSFPASDNGGIYGFEFCGTELNGDALPAEEDRKKLKELLCRRFGYAPYTQTPEIKKHEVSDGRTEITESQECRPA